MRQIDHEHKTVVHATYSLQERPYRSDPQLAEGVDWDRADILCFRSCHFHKLGELMCDSEIPTNASYFRVLFLRGRDVSDFSGFTLLCCHQLAKQLWFKTLSQISLVKNGCA